MHDARDRNQGIWIEYNDRLYVAAYSSVASLVVTFSGYFRKADGEIVEYAVTVNPTSDRAVTAGNQHFGAGFLLSCVATLASGNANRGQCYVRAQVQRSTGTPAIKLHNVLGGYLSDDYSPSFPYGKIEGPLEGPGYIRTYVGTNPAAGADVSETVPTGARWRLLSMYVVLVTSADIALRYAYFDFTHLTLLPWSVLSTQVQTAGLTQYYILSRGLDRAFQATVEYESLPLPEIWLTGGDTIGAFLVGGVAADDWLAPVIAAEEWIEA